MKRPSHLLACVSAAILLAAPAPSAALADDVPVARSAPSSPASPRHGFQRVVLAERYFCDGVTAADVNRDGHVDVVAGPFIYPGPDFTTPIAFYPPVPLPPRASPSNSMFTFAHDFSGDGWPDLLVLGRVHLHPAYWYENPGDPALTPSGDQSADWKKHFAFHRVQGESPTLVDFEADGRPELVCHWEGRWGYIAPQPDTPTAPWRFHPVSDPADWPQFYHGTGVGDLDGDNRLDLVINDGWFSQPASSSSALWPWHPHRFSPARGGAQIYVDDLDADGDADVISSLHAHEWGLAWFEQIDDHGRTDFRLHPIMGTPAEVDRYGVAFSQPHALAYADLDGDGLRDIITGKRMWAHGPLGDVEPAAPPVLYWFKAIRESGTVRFEPRLIDNLSGVGVQLTVADVDGDHRNDVLTASKLGTFLFLNRLPPAAIR